MRNIEKKAWNFEQKPGNFNILKVVKFRNNAVSISAMSRSKEICIIRKKRENGIKITAREDGVSVFVWFRKVKRVGVGVCA